MELPSSCRPGDRFNSLVLNLDKLVLFVLRLPPLWQADLARQTRNYNVNVGVHTMFFSLESPHLLPIRIAGPSCVLRAVPCPLRPRPLGRADAQGRTWRASVDHIHRPLTACPRACRCGHDPGRDTTRAHIVIDEKTALCLQIEGPYSRYCARVWHTFWNSGVEASIEPPNQTANRCM